jgi:hypothetical protein
VHAVLTAEAQLEALGLVSKPLVNQRAHAYSKGWDGCPR